MTTTSVKVYSVTPEFEDPEASDEFPSRVAATARACEAVGWHGILVPHNLHDVDPWLVAGFIGSVTDRFVPLIAVQPACISPHTAAAMAACFAGLYGRPVYFNLVAGARDDEMRRIGDDLPHDERYARMSQYAAALSGLLRGDEMTSADPYYTYKNYRLEPRPEVLADCSIFIAGSSPASLAVAVDRADVIVTHPAPITEWRVEHLEPLSATGYAGEIAIRIGIVCRADGDEARQLAAARFPETWRGRQETLLKTRSPNLWSRRLAELAILEEEQGSVPGDPSGTYWLGAFRTGRASAPFLVGSYDDVADALATYLAGGVSHVLLNGVHNDDYGHTRHAIELAATRSAAGADDVSR